MPPPTSSDSWLASRRFGIVIDAGSSGSRLQIYSWKDPQTILREQGDAVRDLLPPVEKGVREGDEWITKAEPGLSSFADNPEGVAAYLEPLISHARAHIPPSKEADTPIFLLATAGMRLLTPIQQARVLAATCSYLRNTNFRLEDASEDGPCGSSVKIITGEEEGLFGWIAVNYLMDGFVGNSTSPSTNKTTYGFLDMGGASTQIAFEPSEQEGDDLDSYNLVDVRLRLLSGQEIMHRVFVTTWLGYGTNQARERYVAQMIRTYAPHQANDRSVLEDPCLPRGLEMTESPVYVENGVTNVLQPHSLVGTGSFPQCLRHSSPLLNKNAPCETAPCLFNGVRVPPIDFSVSHFIGVSEYWYSSEHVFGLGGPYDFLQYERAATEFCKRTWDSITRQHERNKHQGTLGGDGEVLQDGEVVQTGVWGDNVELSRLQMQCFKAAWITNVLHDGLGLPRIVDPGGNATASSGGDEVAKQAEDKGLGKPIFQSVDTVEDIAISWTLGKMVLEASKDVPLSSSKDRPLVDPVQDIPSTVHDPPIKPIRPPFWSIDALEDKLSPHLPTSLSRESLGFSPVSLIIYALVISFFVCVFYRMRRQVRSAFRRIRSRPLKPRGDYALATESYAMEEGALDPSSFSAPPSPTASKHQHQGHSVLPKSLLRSIRRMISSTPSHRPHHHPHHHHSKSRSHTSKRPQLRHTHSSPTPSPPGGGDPPAPGRTPSNLVSSGYLGAASPYQSYATTNGLGPSSEPIEPSGNSSAYLSRAPSPAAPGQHLALPEDMLGFGLGVGNGHGHGHGYSGNGLGVGLGLGLGTSLSRSRNSSQVSLAPGAAYLTPRAGTLSRSASAMALHDE
ncbi:hypothetical protein CONPUDRAFT_162097 [Coniophora puteana RWD-64-598 SS2]|uniref:Nucleoside diphosphatase n=1 Tax=Coniophora puteana (strain RWD-64-598) TaxID=741705 RepID=A0A5M3N056_CONPW|nr:uncharacterized protein CONPUDRAFT_162097 [Coniophora puteana RWD-64-598 SS2]EIW84748.1 hypothetical protein CONPUDRAFT_162097 [Coniophora puteana RWD-64-598 SS2]